VLNGLNLLLGCFLMQESHGRASTDALESLQPSQLLPVGAGHDYVAAALMTVSLSMQLRTGAGSALGPFGEDRFAERAT